MKAVQSFMHIMRSSYRIVALVCGVLLAMVVIAGGAAGIIRAQEGSANATPSAQEAGHVLVSMYNGIHVLARNGSTLGSRCNGQDGRDIQRGWDVVVLSNTTAFIDGRTYYLIAYPDPCEPGEDFSTNSEISQAITQAEHSDSITAAAVGYVAADMLSEANSVQPSSTSSNWVWRPCWAPTCPDDHLVSGNITLPSADGGSLFAWWTGSYWDPHWWHVHYPSSSEGAAVYGRDWYANSTLVPAAPADHFAFEAQISSVSPSPVLVTGDWLYSLSVTLENEGDRDWNLLGMPDIAEPEDSQGLFGLCPNEASRLQIDGGCVNLAEVASSTSPGSQVTVPVGGNYTPPDAQGQPNVGEFCVVFDTNALPHQACIELPIGSAQPTPTPLPQPNSATPTPNPSLPPTPTPTPTPQPTQPPPGWYPWYQVHRPACDDSSAWSDVNHAATRDCSSSNGLVLSQYSNTAWAELDLDTPNSNQYYNQTEFRVETSVALLNPSDTTVWAALVLQTPQGGACGGFLFAVNSQGLWKLQLTSSSCAISTLQSGSVGNFNPNGFSLQAVVQDGQLAASINGQQVTAWGDNLDPSPGAIGLMEESPRATSSAILYCDFEIDNWS